MSDIEIVLKESNPAKPTKSRSWRISLPADVPVEHVLKALIPKLGLPTQQPDGCQIGYKLYHVQSCKTISDNETLNNAGVAHNDVDKVIKRTPHHKEAWVNKGMTLRVLGRYKEARACFDEAEKLPSENIQGEIP